MLNGHIISSHACSQLNKPFAKKLGENKLFLRIYTVCCEYFGIFYKKGYAKVTYYQEEENNLL